MDIFPGNTSIVRSVMLKVRFTAELSDICVLLINGTKGRSRNSETGSYSVYSLINQVPRRTIMYLKMSLFMLTLSKTAIFFYSFSLILFAIYENRRVPETKSD